MKYYKVCPECGKTFETDMLNRVYDTYECQRRHFNRKFKAKRLAL